MIRLSWGGLTPTRGINGLYGYRHEVGFRAYMPVRHWRRGILVRPVFKFWRSRGPNGATYVPRSQVT